MSKKDLKDDEILRYARVRVTESAANVYTQVEINTQLSVERGIIWLIHSIEFHTETALNLNEVAASGREFITVQVTRESKSAIIGFSESDMVQGFLKEINRSAAIGTDVGPLYFHHVTPNVYHYPVPMPYASQSIFIGLLASDATVVGTITVRIGYTIKEVSDKFFFRVAQALVG